MTLEGTVVIGAVVPDGGVRLPEGARVRLEVVDDPADDELDYLLDPAGESLPDDHPMAPYDREKELAILRQSIEDVKAGRGIPLDEAIEELSREFGLPPMTSDQPFVR